MGKRGNAVRCPKCNRFGSNDLGGYCKKCHGEITEEAPKAEPTATCTRCGKPASRINDEYKGCVPYALCDNCYIEKFGFILASDFHPGSAPTCVQCGEPAFKIHREDPYCLRHYRDRNEEPIEPVREHFVSEFGITDKPFITETFDVVKDKFDMEGKW